MERLNVIKNIGEESARHSHLSYSWRGAPKDTNSQYPSYRNPGDSRAPGDTFTDRDPYGNAVANPQLNKDLGSARGGKSKLIELIQGESSRTSSKKPKVGSSSSR